MNEAETQEFTERISYLHIYHNNSSTAVLSLFFVMTIYRIYQPRRAS
ncbi:hypothetical protein D3OALGA1CA_2863 [Olavius algarvensis associated proteobacterium Delta 3]|nr:hypothetical protein D3OALGA1CA_2863 [Olavius algarvensis associated proteobacterium Delta 3]CAB5163147.1 hypothetical protein D3OALGB2SA_5561 [Olavius algarvensis associated proteobacterium Delta 3]